MSNADDGTERELTEADLLLRKADALLHRYRPMESNIADDDDLPLITDLVSEDGNDELAAARERIELAERLIDLETAISRAVEEWMATELPQIIAHEFDQIAARLRAEALAHMRATLIPRLSEEIATRLTQDPEVSRRR